MEKFRQALKWILLAGFLIFIVGLISYLVLFSSIEKSSKSVKGREIDTTSWNADNDVHSIEAYFYFRKPYHYRYDIVVGESFVWNDHLKRDTRKFTIKEGDSVIYPVLAANYIIEAFDLIALGEWTLAEESEKLMYALHFLQESAVINEQGAAWRNTFRFNKYDLNFDWASAYTQGRVLSALARMYQLTGDSAVLLLCQQASDYCFYPLEEGGIARQESGGICFEEYPTIPPNSVMNGHIFTVWGLYDIYRVTSYDRAKEGFDAGVVWLANHLKDYDMGYWTRYDKQYPYAAGFAYHKVVHISQMRVLYQITGKPVFKEYADKWTTYLSGWTYTRFKLRFLYDSIHRRIHYKSVFSPL